MIDLFFRSLDADGPDGPDLVILIDNPSCVGLICLRNTWMGDSGPLKDVTSPRVIGQDFALDEVKAAMFDRHLP